MISKGSPKTVERVLRILSHRNLNTIRGLSNELEISTTKLKKQILFLKKENIIKSWSIVINPTTQPQNKIFYLFIKTNPNEPAIVSNILQTYDDEELSRFEGITGDFSLVGRFHYPTPSSFLASLEHLYSIVGETGFKKYQLVEVIEIQKLSGFRCRKITDSLRLSEIESLTKIQSLNSQSKYPLSSYQIAKLMKKQQPVVSRQLKKWKDGNVILGYSLITDYWKHNYIHAYVQLKAPLGQYQNVIDFCMTNDHIQDIFRTNQEYSLLLGTRFPNLQELNSFLKNLYTHSTVEDTVTSIVLDFLR
jgi:DNA-binding Lrp family transcriptional regulator